MRRRTAGKIWQEEDDSIDNYREQQWADAVLLNGDCYVKKKKNVE